MAGKSQAQTPRNEKSLEHTEVIMSRVYQNTTIHNIVLSWRVPRYEKLRCNVIYFQFYESVDIKCTLRMFKKEDSLYLCISGSTLPKRTAAEFLILDEVNLSTVKETAEGIGEGVFAAQFQNELFLGSGLRFLNCGVLTISFKYASDRYEFHRETTINSCEILRDLDDLCCDLKNMYLEALFSDFLVHVRNYSFKTHKFILAARSSYFDAIFEKYPNAGDHTLDTIPGIAHEVFLYMYSGELKEMDLECMMSVYELASFLKVVTLVSRCLDYFKLHMNQDNYLLLVKLHVKTGGTALKNLVVHFLKEQMPEVNIVNAFKEAKEAASMDDSGR